MYATHKYSVSALNKQNKNHLHALQHRHHIQHHRQQLHHLGLLRDDGAYQGAKKRKYDSKSTWLGLFNS